MGRVTFILKNEFKYANEAILIKYALICILGIKLAKFVFVSIIYDLFFAYNERMEVSDEENTKI